MISEPLVLELRGGDLGALPLQFKLVISEPAV